MENQDYKLLKEVSKNKGLLDHLEHDNPGITSEIAGHLMRPWLPQGFVRRSVMLAILLLALLGLFGGAPALALFILILPFFSPRVVGELAMWIGRLKGN